MTTVLGGRWPVKYSALAVLAVEQADVVGFTGIARDPAENSTGRFAAAEN